MRSTRACLWQVPHSQQSWCLAPKGRKYWLVTCTKCSAVHKFCGTSTYVLEMMPLLQELCRCAKLSLTNTQIIVHCVFFDQMWSCYIYQHFVPSHIFLHGCFFPFLVPFDSYRVLSLLSRLLTRPLFHRPPSLALQLACTGQLLSSKRDWAQLLFQGISPVQREGQMQKATPTRKSRSCQSVPIREPLLSSALRRIAANVNN